MFCFGWIREVAWYFTMPNDNTMVMIYMLELFRCGSVADKLNLKPFNYSNPVIYFYLVMARINYIERAYFGSGKYKEIYILFFIIQFRRLNYIFSYCCLRCYSHINFPNDLTINNLYKDFYFVFNIKPWLSNHINTVLRAHERFLKLSSTRSF